MMFILFGYTKHGQRLGSVFRLLCQKNLNLNPSYLHVMVKLLKLFELSQFPHLLNGYNKSYVIDLLPKLNMMTYTKHLIQYLGCKKPTVNYTFCCSTHI